MRRIHVGLTGRVSLTLVAALVLALAFAVVASAMPAAPAAPDFQAHCFYGLVKTSGDESLAGEVVQVRAWTGDWNGSETAAIDSQDRYGYTPSLCVDDLSGAEAGDQLAFYVLGVRAQIYDVATGLTSSTFVFDPWNNPGGSNLNLTIPLAYTIQASAGDHGTISPSGNVSVLYGKDQKFVFNPASGYQVRDVVVDGESRGPLPEYTFYDVKANHTIRVEFVRSNYLITPTVGAGCTITPATQQVVPYLGSITFNIGATTGNELVDVLIDGGSIGPYPSYTFQNVDKDHTIEARCRVQQFVITPLVVGGHGRIVPGTEQVVPYNGSITFQIVPDSGYAIGDVKVDGVSVGTPAEVPFTGVKANHTITASFVRAAGKIFLPFLFR